MAGFDESVQQKTLVHQEERTVETSTSGGATTYRSGRPTTGGATTGRPTTTTGGATTGGATTGRPTTGGATTGRPTTGRPTTGGATTGRPTQRPCCSRSLGWLLARSTIRTSFA
jgi:hypothetical protein